MQKLTHSLNILFLLFPIVISCWDFCRLCSEYKVLKCWVFTTHLPMVGLPAFQGVLGEEVQTHRTHHLPRALQTVCNFNILFDNNFLHLCHHPLSKFDSFAWCRQLPKNSETAQKGQKAVICSLNLQLRPLQSDSSCPIFAAKLQKFMQIYLKTLAIYANIFKNVRNLCK